MKIYIVERGVFMNGMEWEFAPCFHASSFEKAQAYINRQKNKKVKITKVNDDYWTSSDENKWDDFCFGIMRVELDKE